MDNLAQNYQNIQPTSVEGLDEVFAVREQDASRTRTGSSVREQGANHLSVEDAAKILGVSVRAIQKRLKKGTLQGRKEKTAQGERWLLDANELVREQDASCMSGSSSVREQDASQLSDCSLVREQGANQLPDSEVISICADVDEDQAHGPAPVDPELLKELLAKLEVLTYRNGYLESQLTERQKELDNQREQIKLLTDSQHKPRWWQRFSSWFFGVR